jgi:Uma2 family endonuclease
MDEGIPRKTEGRDNMTVAEYRELISKKPTKYHNKKMPVDGHAFDSQGEAGRYLELKLLQRAGEIRGFGIQPSFVLPGGIRYRPDFIVCGKDGTIWVEDFKSEGTITQTFKMKYKLWEVAYPFLELRVINAKGETIYAKQA